MLLYLNKILTEFKKCFTRQRTFNWFVIIILGLIIRYDLTGLTSIVRAFSLNAVAYAGIKHFFKSSSYNIKSLNNAWLDVVEMTAPKLKIGGRSVLVGDGYQRPVEGKHMPATGCLKSSSNNSKRPASFFGNFFGSIGILAKKTGNILCIPLQFSIQKENEILDAWSEKKHYSHSERILIEAFNAAGRLGNCLLVLDRYFLSESLLRLYDDLCFYSVNFNKLHLVLRCKKNVVGYEFPRLQFRKSRGRKPQYGTAVKLNELFNHRTFFKQTYVKIYGKTEHVYYYSKVLIWKKGFKRNLRFVLAEYNNSKIILATTDLQANPVDVIVAYSYRFKIEHMFKSFSNIFGGSFYHFWTNALDKLNRYRTSDPNNLKETNSQRKRIRILRAYHRIHVFVLCACIAQGIVQLLCLKFSQIDPSTICFQRTYKQNGLSEWMMKQYLQQNLTSFVLEEPDLEISLIIHKIRKRYLIKI